MNDFFFHLAARSFDHAGEIELVRPRLPSLFESALERRHDFEEFLNGSERSEVFNSSREDSPQPTDRRPAVQVNLNFESRKDPHERSAQLPEDSERKPFYSVGASTKTQDQAAPIDSDPVFQTRVQFESLGDDTIQSSQKASELSIPPSPLRFEIPGRLEEEMRLSSMSATPDKGSGQDEDSGVVWQLPTERPENPPKKRAVTPVLVEKVRLIETIQKMIDRELPPGKKESENRESGIGRSAFQPIGSVFHPRKEIAMRGAASQPEPTINVTIGRIEVRATVLPQKNLPEPVKRLPVMSLEEYLRRRTGGRDS